jgi:hypothetical protein
MEHLQAHTNAFDAFITKGWTRCTTLLFVLHVLIENSLTNQVKEVLPDVFSSFCTVYGFISFAKNEIERIDLNRGASSSEPCINSSVVIRMSPNIYNV